jgi:hypothetical protein
LGGQRRGQAVMAKKKVSSVRRVPITWVNEQNMRFFDESKPGECDSYMKKADGGSGYNAGCSSEEAISSTTCGGIQGLEWSIGNTGHTYICGLSTGDKNLAWDSIGFGLYCGNNNHIHIYENGMLIGAFGTYEAGDRMAIKVEAKKIKYYKGSKRLYTSKESPVFPLNIDCSFWSEGARLIDVTLYKKPEASLKVSVDSSLM